jgi:hypothetical protein
MTKLQLHSSDIIGLHTLGAALVAMKARCCRSARAMLFPAQVSYHVGKTTDLEVLVTD